MIVTAGCHRDGYPRDDAASDTDRQASCSQGGLPTQWQVGRRQSWASASWAPEDLSRRVLARPRSSRRVLGCRATLRNKPGLAEMGAERPLALANTFERIARRIEEQLGTVEHELTRWADEARALSAEERAHGPRKSRRILPAGHTGTPHRHDLLCVAPASGCAGIRRIAARLRVLDAKVSTEGLPPPALPNVNVRAKAAPLGTRPDERRALDRMAGPVGVRPRRRCARHAGPGVRKAVSSCRARTTFRSDAEGSGLPGPVRADHQRHRRGKCTTRAIRGLAQEAFNGGSALEALAQSIGGGESGCDTRKRGSPVGRIGLPRARAEDLERWP